MTPKGSTYTVVENAGYIGETERKRGFKLLTAAIAWMQHRYSEDEIEELHVCIRRDHTDGSNTYEY